MSFNPQDFLSHINQNNGLSKPAKFEVQITIPTILSNLLKERKLVKKLMKNEKDPFKYRILDAKQLSKLPEYLKAVAYSKFVLKFCLAFSIFYNIIGLSFAISGTLTPFVAAILMPTSSISVVLLSTFLIQLRYRRL